MKIDLLGLLTIYLLGYFQSEYTSYIVNSLLGKFIIILIVIQLTIHRPYLGVLLIILYVFLSKSTPHPKYYELMTNMDTNNFKNKYCNNNKLVKNDNVVSKEQISTFFPNLFFKNGKCNPCDDSCEFNITTSSERLTTEDNIRPTSSKLHKVCKKIDPNDDMPEPKPNDDTQQFNNI